MSSRKRTILSSVRASSHRHQRHPPSFPASMARLFRPRARYPGCSHGRTPKMPIVLLRVVSPPTAVIDAYPLQRHRPSANRHEQQLLAEFPHVDSSTIVSLEACRQAPLSGPQRRSASAHLQYKDDFVTDQRLGKLLATGLLL